MHPFIITKEKGDCPVCGMKLIPKVQDKVKNTNKGERKIAFWKAPMNPSEIYKEPGKSAMGMDLVPVYEDEVKGGVEITIDPVTQQNMGVRTAIVKTSSLDHTIRTFGHITYDETKTFKINPRYSGWVEKLNVNFKGQMVKKGASLFTVYSPELVTAEEEYLEAFRNYKKSGTGFNKKFLDAVKRRLSNYGISQREIKKIESANKAENTITIRSPFTGVVTEKNIVEGGYFKAGTNVFAVSDLSIIWVEAHIYEYELSRIKKGFTAEMTLPYLPGKVFVGKVKYIYPYLQKRTRDIVVLIEFDNKDLSLKPDMYADVKIKTTADKDGLVIPSESVIRSGEKNIVFVTKGNGKFIPRNVSPGITLDNGNIHIISGLAPGETIVTSGQFLLDSESKLKEAVAKMLEAEKTVVKTEEKETKPEKSDDAFFDDM
jgi:RND family efflux transporter MFP subunit